MTGDGDRIYCIPVGHQHGLPDALGSLMSNWNEVRLLRPVASEGPSELSPSRRRARLQMALLRRIAKKES